MLSPLLSMLGWSPCAAATALLNALCDLGEPLCLPPFPHRGRGEAHVLRPFLSMLEWSPCAAGTALLNRSLLLSQVAGVVYSVALVVACMRPVLVVCCMTTCFVVRKSKSKNRPFLCVVANTF